MFSKILKAQLILIATLGICVSFIGCNKKAAMPTCKKDADCEKGVCHMGKCEECVTTADCSDSKQCISNRCETTCQVDADCGANKHCQDNICHNDCGGVDNIACSGDRVCSNGRCYSQFKGQDPTSVAGCQNLEKIHYDFDKFEITSAGQELAQRLVSCLESNPGFTITIEGHTDDRGTPAYNQVLGEKRALAVKQYLESKGIASSRIETVSYGESKPIMDVKNEQAWYQNRRAEFNLKAGG